ncbi:hypothetical protein [Wenyingzhuangia sp. IMCC45574]
MKPLFTILLLFIGQFSFSQNTNNSVESKTIEEQFQEIYKKSSTYENFKVIRITKYNTLKTNVLDTLALQKSSLAQTNSLISNHQKQTKALEKKAASLETQLNSAVNNRDNRSVFGIPVSKSIFSIILVVTHTVLILLVAFFAYQYKNNAVSTKKAVENLQSLEEEFEQHKKSSLKRYQELNRKLQDELNKQWKKDNKG